MATKQIKIDGFRSCPICGHSNARRVSRIRYHQGGESILCRCLHCDYHYVNPEPTLEFLRAFYEDDYCCFITQAQGWQKAATIERIRKLERLNPPGRKLLDVGCGTAYFCQLARERGWESWGVDPTESAIESASVLVREFLTVGTIESLEFPNEYFDVITFWAVIEHLLDPIQTIERAIAMLKVQGVLLFQLPLIESWAARIYRDSWRLLSHSPDHVGFITLGTVKYLTKQYPIELIDYRYTGYPFPMGNSRQKNNKRTVIRRESNDVLSRFVTIAFRHPWFLRLVKDITHILRLGDNIEFVLRKNANWD